MPDKQTWQFINTFAPWLSALGTISAVVVAMYLAWRADQIKLVATAGLWRIAGGQDPGRDCFLVAITNLGRRHATINIMYWRMNRWTKAGVVLIAPQNMYSSKFPITLQDGGTAQFASFIEDFEMNFQTMATENFRGIRGWFRLQAVRFAVSTSTNHLVTCRPSKDLRKKLREMAKKCSNSA